MINSAYLTPPLGFKKINILLDVEIMVSERKSWELLPPTDTHTEKEILLPSKINAC